MLISYEHRFLFFHVPKTGGTSIRESLTRFAHDPLSYGINQLGRRLGIKVNHIAWDHRKRRFRTHERARVVRRNLPADVFDSLFKFAFVRNPWELLVSQYKFIRKERAHRRHSIVKQMSFAEFVPYAHQKRLCQQVDRLVDQRQNLLVDFVGRFETLQQDYHHIMDKLELPIRPMLPHNNRTRPDRFRDYYSSGLREKVRVLWQADIERFGYTFAPSARTARAA